MASRFKKHFLVADTAAAKQSLVFLREVVPADKVPAVQRTITRKLAASAPGQTQQPLVAVNVEGRTILVLPMYARRVPGAKRIVEVCYVGHASGAVKITTQVFGHDTIFWNAVELVDMLGHAGQPADVIAQFVPDAGNRMTLEEMLAGADLPARESQLLRDKYADKDSVWINRSSASIWLLLDTTTGGRVLQFWMNETQQMLLQKLLLEEELQEDDMTDLRNRADGQDLNNLLNQHCPGTAIALAQALNKGLTACDSVEHWLKKHKIIEDVEEVNNSNGAATKRSRPKEASCMGDFMNGLLLETYTFERKVLMHLIAKDSLGGDIRAMTQKEAVEAVQKHVVKKFAPIVNQLGLKNASVREEEGWVEKDLEKVKKRRRVIRVCREAGMLKPTEATLELREALNGNRIYDAPTPQIPGYIE